MRNVPSWWLAVPLAMALSLVACGDSKPAPKKKPAPVAAAAPPTPAPAPEAAAEEPETAEAEPEYVYTPIGKRDPFRSPFADLEVARPEDSGDRTPKTDLQKWGVEQLTLRASITGTSSPMAMVVDPEGKGHAVRRGTLIGKNWGKVTAIKRDCIVITEQLRDATGAVMAIKQERCLPRTQREVEMEKQLD